MNIFKLRTACCRPLLLAACLLKPLVLPAQPPPPPAAIILGPRLGHVVPTRQGFTHTGGGNIQVVQPSPDAVVLTMTGAVMAGAHPLQDSFASLQFDLRQDFEISAPAPAQEKLSVEARLLGLLRTRQSGCCGRGLGTAENLAACATITAEQGELVSVAVEPHVVTGGDDLSVNDHAGPVEIVISPGKYSLHGRFVISAAHARTLLPCGHASAEFAPEAALDPLWLGNRESFHGAIKRDFGFQVSLRVSPDPATEKADGIPFKTKRLQSVVSMLQMHAQ